MMSFIDCFLMQKVKKRVTKVLMKRFKKFVTDDVSSEYYKLRQTVTKILIKRHPGTLTISYLRHLIYCVYIEISHEDKSLFYFHCMYLFNVQNLCKNGWMVK
ncbi:hypothetical protein ACF0H5_012179 [Mactra antiquata]